MTCRWRNSDSDTLLQCMGLQAVYSEAQVSSYATRVGAAGPGKWGYFYAVSCLRINRMIRPAIPEGPCSNFRNVGGGATSEIGLANRSASIVGAALAGPTLGLSALAAGIFSSLTNLFGSLFSGAPSAKELQTQCLVTEGWNQFASQMEQALRSGQIPLQDALQQLTMIHDQLYGSARSVGGGQDAAPYGLEVALDALELFNKEVIYPSLPGGILGGSSGGLFIVGGGLVAAKVAGAF